MLHSIPVRQSESPSEYGQDDHSSSASQFDGGNQAEFAAQSPVLNRLKLKSSRGKRMERVEKLTTLHWHAKNSVALNEQQRQRYEEVFKRYDVSRTVGLNLAECHDA